ncbi:hypothetical protein MKX47_12115 [Solibacillus sp. FSL R7-0668]|uniref:hypothetical protein n=1 Tax=Solibacillus sp. FSL R7-0668 TaxID=2921688 RepID=UPI0030F904ED
MKVYDAKIQQTCEICGFQINHNKQGRFTSHLKNEHGLTLNEYLIQFFYDQKQLICSYELCDKQVSLRRGIPNLFCTISCGGKGTPLVCEVCLTKFDEKNRNTKTCSKKCAKILRSKNTSNWHNQMNEEDKIKHFENIISKTAITRRKNNTPSWNSGKTGIYSEETIAKIRNATLKQLGLEAYRKTRIEVRLEKFLIEKNIPYKYSFITNKVQFDFYLMESNILIECDGDFWHANPKFYPDETKWYHTQKRIRAKDLVKNEIAKQLSMTLLRFWEDDIMNNFEFVEKSIINALSATT